MKQQQEEKKNNNKAELPDELWLKVLEDVDDKSVTAFASASKQLRRVQKESGRRLKTNFKVYFYDLRTSQMYYDYSESIPIDKELAALSEDWCLWSMSSLTLKKEKMKRRRIMNAAAFWGHLNALKQWKEQSRAKSLFDQQTCIFAASGGHLDVLMWLRDNGYPWHTVRTCNAAARGGNLEMLKYLAKNGRTWNPKTCSQAAAGGHLEMVKYLHENQCPWNGGTCSFASRGGYLEVLKYAHENGCPWNQVTCSYAAAGGHLEVLKYAHENGCRWDAERICNIAGKFSHLEIVEYVEGESLS